MYRWVDHTGELELEIEAPDEHTVFEEALAAIFELTEGEADADGDTRPDGDALTASARAGESREIEVVATDRPALLAGWLEELLFLAETEDLVPVRLARLELAGGHLSATIEGRLGRPRHLVKAVTYHGLVFEPSGGRWRARVVLDV